MANLDCPFNTECPSFSKARDELKEDLKAEMSKVKKELEKKLDAEKARHRSVILEMESVIVDLMVENYRYESRVKALERLLGDYEKNHPITDTREEESVALECLMSKRGR